MTDRVAPKEFLQQLSEYLQQKPPAEYPIHRGHRVRQFKGGHLNRYHPLTKKSHGTLGDGALCHLKKDRNRANFVATAAAVYNANPDDFHISANTMAAPVAINLPLAAAAGPGTELAVKDTMGTAPMNAITVIPSGLDTIDRAGPIIMMMAWQVTRFISDGVGNWEVK